MHALHPLAVMAEGPRAASGLDALSLASTVAYAVLGVLLLMVFTWAINTIFKLDLRRELIEDQNIGLGVAFAGTALAIAIIIAATILS